VGACSQLRVSLPEALRAQVCEGLPAGEYEIKQAQPDDVEVRAAPPRRSALPVQSAAYSDPKLQQRTGHHGAQKMVQHAVRLSQGLSGTERTPEAETAGSEGGWLSKLTGFLRKT
jgi:hypothetical protein